MTAANVDSTVPELAHLLARGYVRLLAERAAWSPENARLSTAKPLDSWAETRPPCAAPEARPT